MGMQAKAWMTGHLFKAWIGHFVKNICECGLGISPSCCHLLILDGHGSHLTMDVVKTARAVGLDLLMLPSHTSHAMQPLDVSCFKLFKQAFRLLRDVWTLRNKSRGAPKEVLATWVSSALEKALTEKNITSGFRTTDIFPLNPQAMDDKMGPSEFYREVPVSSAGDMPEPEAVDLAAPEILQTITGTFTSNTQFAQAGRSSNTTADSTGMGGPAVPTALGGGEPVVSAQSGSPEPQADCPLPGAQWAHSLQAEEHAEAQSVPSETDDEDEGANESEAEEDYLSNLEAVLAEPEEQEHGLSRRHYFVHPEEGQEEEDHGWGEEVGFTEDQESGDSIDRFLVLPQQDAPIHRSVPTGGEPQIDYSRSHILTSEEFVASLEAKAAKKQQLLEEARLRKIAGEENREKKRLEK
jgi:hypothetical protein